MTTKFNFKIGIKNLIKSKYFDFIKKYIITYLPLIIVVISHILKNQCNDIFWINIIIYRDRLSEFYLYLNPQIHVHFFL